MIRKILFPLLIALLAFSLFVSCEQATEPITPPVDPVDPVDPPVDPPIDPPVDPPVETEKVLYFPGFDLIESGSRGMTVFPSGTEDYENCPFLSDSMYAGDHPAGKLYLACNAMSALPLLPPFEKMTVKPSEFVNELSSNSIYIYGFPAHVDKTEINEDGIFMRFVATEKDSRGEDKNIAMCEYYYNWDEGTFSYREIAVPFMHNTYSVGDNILAFQMYNVPIKEEDGNIIFNAGVKDGQLDKDTAITLYKIHLPAESGGTWTFRVDEISMIMNCQGPRVYATGYKMAQSYEGATLFDIFGESGLHTFLNDPDNIEEYGYGYNPGNYRLNLSDDKSNIEFGYGVMGCLFEDMDAILAAEGIESMDDFNDLKFVYKTDLPADCALDNIRWDLSYCTIFDIEAETGATTTGMHNELFRMEDEMHSGPSAMIQAFFDVYGQTEGDAYYGLENISRFFDVLMDQCGLSEDGIASLASEHFTHYVAP